MKSACYITYTINGFNRIAFSYPATEGQSIFDKFREKEETLDVPPSFALRPGSWLFRRQRITNQRGELYAYSAYIGASEMAQSRAGSFLGWTVIFEHPIGPGDAPIGSQLSELLTRLIPFVIKDDRFFAPPSEKIVEQLVLSSATTLSAFGRIPSYFEGTSSPPRIPHLYFSMLDLPTAFDQICGEVHSAVDVYLIKGTSKDAVFASKSEFNVLEWPRPPQLPKPDRATDSQADPFRTNRSSSTSDVKSSQNYASTAAIGRNSDLEALRTYVEFRLAEHETFLKYLVGVLVGIMLISAIGIGWIANRQFTDVKELKRSVELLAEHGRQSSSPAEPVAKKVESPLPEPEPRLETITIKNERATIESIRTSYCAAQNGNVTSHQKFTTALKAANKWLNQDSDLVKGITLYLPAGCKSKK